MFSSNLSIEVANNGLRSSGAVLGRELEVHFGSVSDALWAN
jgi:hypothetical protein